MVSLTQVGAVVKFLLRLTRIIIKKYWLLLDWKPRTLFCLSKIWHSYANPQWNISEYTWVSAQWQRRDSTKLWKVSRRYLWFWKNPLIAQSKVNKCIQIFTLFMFVLMHLTSKIWLKGSHLYDIWRFLHMYNLDTLLWQVYYYYLFMKHA